MVTIFGAYSATKEFALQELYRSRMLALFGKPPPSSPSLLTFLAKLKNVAKSRYTNLPTHVSENYTRLSACCLELIASCPKKNIYRYEPLPPFPFNNSSTTLHLLQDMTIPTLIPRKVIFDNPTHLEPRISPDGKRIAFIAPKDDVLNIWIALIDNPADAKCITKATGSGIREFQWTYNNQIVYGLDKNGDEGIPFFLDW